ncbi:hypothetical protein ACH5RR_018979 [Cinchona calisaya]|uniref:Uncharacterized protein n=1 Tax=Cinchona calisaya TaxID=153742 RepID=A0ABD2ZRM2_9GENT
MRYKSWPYYEDWTEMFGEDRVTGKHAEVADALRNFTEKTEARLGMIDERIGYEHDMRESKQKVYASLNPMTWLFVEDKLLLHA